MVENEKDVQIRRITEKLSQGLSTHHSDSKRIDSSKLEISLDGLEDHQQHSSHQQTTKLKIIQVTSAITFGLIIGIAFAMTLT